LNDIIRDRIKETVRQVFEEKELKHIVQWADDHFFLSASATNTKGQRWKTHGYQKFILHAFSDLDTRDTVCIKPIQVGLSQCAKIGIGYESAHRKRSNGIWLPRRSDADEFSNVQIQSMLEDVKEVADELKTDIDKKDKDNTSRRRAFYGAQSYCRATQTPQDVSSISIETGYADELSKMPRRLRATAKDEGTTPVNGIRGRMTAATWPKLNMLSSPLEFGNCQITEQFEDCREKFHRHYQCPECETWQVFEWGDAKSAHGFKWDRVADEYGDIDDFESAKTVYYQCSGCDHRFVYNDIVELDENRGQWRSEKIGFDEVNYKYFDLESGEEVESPYSVGIQVRGWMSRTKSWFEGCYEFLQATRDVKEGDRSKLITWTEDYEGSAYRAPELNQYIKHGYLMSRRESWKTLCPDEVQAVTKDWDVQEDRIECMTVGWGYKEESWILKHEVFWGNPATTDVLKHVRRGVDDESIVKPGGNIMPVFLTGIDAGYLTDLVHDVAKGKYKSKIIPHMGMGTIGKPIVTPRMSGSKKRRTMLSHICVDSAKDLIYNRYLIDVPGPGYVHIGDHESLTEELIKQMVAEKKTVVKNVLRWVCPDGIRNEGLDCFVGNLAMIKLAQQRYGLTLREPSAFSRNTGETPTMSIEDMAGVFS